MVSLGPVEDRAAPTRNKWAMQTHQVISSPQLYTFLTYLFRDSAPRDAQDCRIRHRFRAVLDPALPRRFLSVPALLRFGLRPCRSRFLAPLLGVANTRLQIRCEALGAFLRPSFNDLEGEGHGTMTGPQNGVCGLMLRILASCRLTRPPFTAPRKSSPRSAPASRSSRSRQDRRAPGRSGSILLGFRNWLS